MEPAHHVGVSCKEVNQVGFKRTVLSARRPRQERVSVQRMRIDEVRRKQKAVAQRSFGVQYCICTTKQNLV